MSSAASLRGSAATQASGRRAAAKTAIPVHAGSSYRLFKEVPLLQGERVSLGNDRDDVDHLAETPHELHIQRPQTGGRTKTLNEQTCVNTLEKRLEAAT